MQSYWSSWRNRVHHSYLQMSKKVRQQWRRLIGVSSINLDDSIAKHTSQKKNSRRRYVQILALIITFIVLAIETGGQLGFTSRSVFSNIFHSKNQAKLAESALDSSVELVPLDISIASHHPLLHNSAQFSQQFIQKIPSSEMQCREAVLNAIKHAWDGYESVAFGHDELQPLSKTYQDNWGGLGWSVVDSLGTLYISGLTSRFNRARNFVETLDFTKNVDVSVFESTIRVLGGLLSAFDLSGDEMFIIKAKQLGLALLPAFDTVTGLAAAKINLQSGMSHFSSSVQQTSLLAEVGSLQMEFGYLTQLTNDTIFNEKATKAWIILKEAANHNKGLYQEKVSLTSGNFLFDASVSLGGCNDSFYEYLLKYFVLSGGTRTEVLDMYIDAIDAVLENLLIEYTDEITKRKRATLLMTKFGRIKEDKFEHLSCFVPGMLALGAQYGEEHQIPALLMRKERHMDIAEMLIETCTDMYLNTATGLAPEYVIGASKGYAKPGQDKRYLLRPETVESLFILHRVTHKPQYRQQGWRIFAAIETHCRTDLAYAAVSDVTSKRSEANQENNMESFFIAETLKYLYLLFSPDTLLPLNRYVFTTEAHPFRIITANRIAEPLPLSIV